MKLRIISIAIVTLATLTNKTQLSIAERLQNCDIQLPQSSLLYKSNFSKILLPGSTHLVSRAYDGTLANSTSRWPSISEDSRYVAFSSAADNLVPDDLQMCDLYSCTDVFMVEVATGQIKLISRSSSGVNGNSHSDYPAVSGDGRYIAFVSGADNLIENDTNGFADIFVFDQSDNETKRVSVASDGTQANGDSNDPAISSDGRYIAFLSEANNLVSDDINGTYDIFVHDMVTAQTIVVSVTNDGTPMSGDMPSISANGEFVVFRSSQNVFLHVIQTGETIRVSVTGDGGYPNGSSYGPSISADGNYIVYGSYASDIVEADFNQHRDIFMYDRQMNSTSRITMGYGGEEANQDSYYAVISSNGSYVAIYSYASNLVQGDDNGAEDIFVVNTEAATTYIVSIASNGDLGNRNSYALPSISGDGRYVVFMSDASNLVSDDINGYGDIFIRDTIGFPIYLPFVVRR